MYKDGKEERLKRREESGIVPGGTETAEERAMTGRASERRRHTMMLTELATLCHH